MTLTVPAQLCAHGCGEPTRDQKSHDRYCDRAPVPSARPVVLLSPETRARKIYPKRLADCASAYLRGIDAYRTGMASRACPFDETREHRYWVAWHFGFEDAAWGNVGRST